MRILLALIACALLGLVGFVVVKEQQRGSLPASVGGGASDQAVATISTGEAIDVASRIPTDGLTIVCFSADF
tara:strand:- start:175461 stop:175676 length:216 start_codon:yes stop_codon:yes gene_type:complete